MRTAWFWMKIRGQEVGREVDEEAKKVGTHHREVVGERTHGLDPAEVVPGEEDGGHGGARRLRPAPLVALLVFRGGHRVAHLHGVQVEGVDDLGRAEGRHEVGVGAVGEGDLEAEVTVAQREDLELEVASRDGLLRGGGAVRALDGDW